MFGFAVYDYNNQLITNIVCFYTATHQDLEIWGEWLSLSKPKIIWMIDSSFAYFNSKKVNQRVSQMMIKLSHNSMTKADMKHHSNAVPYLFIQ